MGVIGAQEEIGELVYELDTRQSRLPPFLALSFHSYQKRRVTQRLMAGRHGDTVHFECLLVPVGPFLPGDFPNLLRVLDGDTWTIVLQYHTQHSRWTSPTRTLQYVGDFKRFCALLLWDWEEYGFDQQLRMYKLADPSKTYDDLR